MSKYHRSEHSWHSLYSIAFVKAIPSSRNSEVLALEKANLGTFFFSQHCKCHMLRSLAVNDANLGNGIPEIRVNHDRLCHLQITKSPILESLDISNCPSIKDETLRDIAKSCGNLRSLDASYCQISLLSLLG